MNFQNRGEEKLLETFFLNLLERIIQVQHQDSYDEKSLLSRNWEFIFSDFNGWLALYCSTKNIADGYWVYPMLHPQDDVANLKEQLPSFNVNTPSVAYSHIMSGERHWIEPCWGKPEDFFNVGMPLFFYRQYYGYSKGKESYYEFHQLVTHLLDLHWSSTLNSYCKMNDLGEEVEKIKIIQHDEVSLILMRKRILEKLLCLGKWTLVRYFDFTRFNTDNPSFDSCTSTVYESAKYEIKYEITRFNNNECIKFRGAQIVRPELSKEKVLSWRYEGDDEETEDEYCEFIVYDWKNKKILKNYSINPKNFASYFTKSNLPFETSPIFFKADVLDKYRNNPDKYDLKETTISCRGGWHLETYGINKYNQVHTYAVYLARLPYKEQLYWLPHNEESKGGISKRAFQTDFEGKFPDEESKLEMLYEALGSLSKTTIGDDKLIIWAPKGGSYEAASKGLYYVTSENSNQWHDFIIALANLTNEGFLKKSLGRVAKSLGNTNKELGTLGLIKYILSASNNQDKIPIIYDVLNDLQIKRGKGKAHGNWDTPEGSLIKDADNKLQDVINAIKELSQVIKTLEVPNS
ncbi:MAG: hypothetical protein ACTSWK_14865 [Promethearchaeota archaeon]